MLATLLNTELCPDAREFIHLRDRASQLRPDDGTPESLWHCDS